MDEEHDREAASRERASRAGDVEVQALELVMLEWFYSVGLCRVCEQFILNPAQ